VQIVYSRVSTAAQSLLRQRHILTDPQTSGGLLVSCAPEAVPAVLDVFRQHGCDRAARMGGLVEGATVVNVDP